jgi:hypothetical protein
MRSDYADRVRSTTTVLQNTKAPIVAKQNRLRHFSISTNRQYDLLVTLTQESVITADQNQDLFRLISNKEPQAVRFIQKGVYLEKVIHTGYVVTLKYEISKISPKGVTKIASTGQACSYECAVSFVCIQDTNQQNTQNNSESNSIIAQILLSRAVSLLGSYRSSNGTLVKLDEIKLEFVR